MATALYTAFLVVGVLLLLGSRAAGGPAAGSTGSGLAGLLPAAFSSSSSSVSPSLKPYQATYQALAPLEYGRIAGAVAAFDAEWEASHTAARATRLTVRRMYDLSDDVQDAMGSLLAALPCDTALRGGAKQLAERLRTEHWAKIEDLKARCGAPLLFPRSIEDQHYRKWWRAANDYDDDS